MTSQTSHRWSWSALLTGLLVLAAAGTVYAENNGKREGGEGAYAHLTAEWWQWVFSRPAIDIGGTNTNPVLDSTGAYAAAGQENGIGPGRKYFFLAGTFGGNAVRTVTVPTGKALFFPIRNAEVDNASEPPTNFTVAELRALLTAHVDGIPVSSLSATLDGVPLEIFRVKSPAFAYTLPDENSLYDYFGLIGPQFEGRVKPVVADGYWAFIPPLPSGSYVLEFASDILAVTYFLTIS